MERVKSNHHSHFHNDSNLNRTPNNSKVILIFLLIRWGSTYDSWKELSFNLTKIKFMGYP